MKKITLALVAVMLVLGMTQCKKEQPTPTPDPTPDGETVYISMKVEDGGKHIVYPGTGAYVFENNDKIYVGNDGRYVGTLTYTDGAFSGSITSPHTNDYLHFYFTGGKAPATAPSAGSTTSFTVDISDQSSMLPVLSYGRSHIKYVNNTTVYSCMLENKCGLIRFKPSVSTSNAINISGMKTIATINFASGSEGIAPVDATTGTVTLFSVSDTEKWAALLPQDEVVNPTVTIDGFTATLSRVPQVIENMYPAENFWWSIEMKNGLLNVGEFTINSQGKKVKFSQGNLQYIGSAPTPYWKFAENQYEILGDNGQGSDNINADRDLFGWATSGYHDPSETYNTNYYPYSTSTSTVNSTYNYYGYGPSVVINPSGSGYAVNITAGHKPQYDWGVYNAISNGGGTANTWRTLSWKEWEYLLMTRTNASSKYGFGKVNGINGMILLPDDWTLPGICYFIPANQTLDDNHYTIDYWRHMEDNGAVFLPFDYYRNGTSLVQSNTSYYWSATAGDTNSHKNAMALRILLNTNGYVLKSVLNAQRNFGCYVRLVRDVE